jgi:hypothetical protein
MPTSAAWVSRLHRPISWWMASPLPRMTPLKLGLKDGAQAQEVLSSVLCGGSPIFFFFRAASLWGAVAHHCLRNFMSASRERTAGSLMHTLPYCFRQTFRPGHPGIVRGCAGEASDGHFPVVFHWFWVGFGPAVGAGRRLPGDAARTFPHRSARPQKWTFCYV